MMYTTKTLANKTTIFIRTVRSKKSRNKSLIIIGNSNIIMGTNMKTIFKIKTIHYVCFFSDYWSLKFTSMLVS